MTRTNQPSSVMRTLFTWQVDGHHRALCMSGVLGGHAPTSDNLFEQLAAHHDWLRIHVPGLPVVTGVQLSRRLTRSGRAYGVVLFPGAIESVVAIRVTGQASRPARRRAAMLNTSELEAVILRDGQTTVLASLADLVVELLELALDGQPDHTYAPVLARLREERTEAERAGRTLERSNVTWALEDNVIQMVAGDHAWLVPHVPYLPRVSYEQLTVEARRPASLNTGPHWIGSAAFTYAVLRLALQDRPEHPYAPVLRRLEAMAAARRLNGGELSLDDIRAALERAPRSAPSCEPPDPGAILGA